MSSCHDMAKGEVYTCAKCGLELQVLRECDNKGKADCECHEEGEDCSFSCCGQPLTKKA